MAVVAARRMWEKDGCVCLDPETTVLTDLVAEGQLDWTAPADGTYELFVFWLHGTGQTARPSCGISYTVNYLDRYGAEALIDYWDHEVMTEDLRKTLRESGRGMMYMDSLERPRSGRADSYGDII